MLVDNRKIYVYWRNNPTSYAVINKDVMPAEPILIGSSVTGANKMLANAEEQNILMPDIIGVGPTSPDWTRTLKNYWNGIRVEVPQSGKELEIGFIYDVDAPEKRGNIKSINDNMATEKGKLATDLDLKNYIDNRINNVIDTFNTTMNNLKKVVNEVDRDRKESEAYRIKWENIAAIESERYKVGRPIITEDYMLYRYCLNYNHVANEFKLVDKSPSIRFYLHSEAEIAKYKEDKHNLDKASMRAYLDVSKSVSSIEDAIYAMGYGELMPTDDMDKAIFLRQKMESEQNRFISIANDKNLTLIGRIERYVSAGVLARLAGTQIVVDDVDRTKILGNNLKEVISFFSNKENTPYINELESRYKGLPK